MKETKLVWGTIPVTVIREPGTMSFAPISDKEIGCYMQTMRDANPQREIAALTITLHKTEPRTVSLDVELVPKTHKDMRRPKAFC